MTLALEEGQQLLHQLQWPDSREQRRGVPTHGLFQFVLDHDGVHELLSFLDLVQSGYSYFQLYFVGQVSAADISGWRGEWCHGL